MGGQTLIILNWTKLSGIGYDIFDNTYTLNAEISLERGNALTEDIEISTPAEDDKTTIIPAGSENLVLSDTVLVYLCDNSIYCLEYDTDGQFTKYNLVTDKVQIEEFKKSIENIK